MNARTFLLAAGVLAGTALLDPNPLTGQERVSLSSPQVAIYNIAGEVRIERGTGSNVIIEVTRGGKDGDRLHIERGERDGWQLLVVRYPEGSVVYRRLGRFSRSEFNLDSDGIFGHKNLHPDLGIDRVTAKTGSEDGNVRMRVAGSGRGLEAHADLRILVPAGKAVAVHLGVGRIAVNDVAADLQIDTRSGAVSVNGARGFLRIDTGSGSINVTDVLGDVALNTGSGGVEALTLGKGLLKIHTGSGSVEVGGIAASEMSVSTGSGGVTASDVSAPLLSLSTGSGGIRARSVKAGKFDLHTGSGSITLDLDSDVQVGRVRTGSGGVTITTSRAFGAEVTLDSGSGGIDVDVPLDLIERRRSFVRGRIGDGQGTLQVNTGSGGIALR